VSSADFRQIALGTDSGKADRLFRAAVSAFCSLPRPSRREIAQIEDLALPLFDSVSVESRRFAAAALSECAHPPTALVWRLSNEPVDVAAPLLVRSQALSDVDLITLIGRHGLPHARAIAKRRGLNKTIADLVNALSRTSTLPEAVASPATDIGPAPSNDHASEFGPRQGNKSNAEVIRQRLRTLMRPSQDSGAFSETGSVLSAETVAYAKLRAAALTGSSALFEIALADALRIDPRQVRRLTADANDLAMTLRTLDLTEEQAFLLSAALFPAAFRDTPTIRTFLESFRRQNVSEAQARLGGEGSRAIGQ
jgi:uncharacterized protein (DUF2336 family)